MHREDYWELFWESGLPEAWMMSRPGWGDFNPTDVAAAAVPHRGSDLPDEVQQLCRAKAEQGMTDLPGSSLTGE